MCADRTGLLTDAIQAGHVADASLPDAGRHQWERLLAGIHTVPENWCARITVAGQWRILTALPEHSVAGQRCVKTTGCILRVAGVGEIQV